MYRSLNQLSRLFAILLLATLTRCQHMRNTTTFKADLDTSYSNGSGIDSIVIDSAKIHALTNLGMLWGFIKYYHANVNKRDFNMDAELFRVLPKVMAAKSAMEEGTILEQWVGHLDYRIPVKTVGQS